MFRSIDAISQKIKAFPQSFVVETKTGGSGSVGKAAALAAEADGYTLTVADDGNIYQQLGGDQPFKYNDFTYISRMVIDYNLVVVRAESPYKSLRELADAAKSKPKGFVDPRYRHWQHRPASDGPDRQGARHRVHLRVV